jgi:uncharacterized protein
MPIGLVTTALVGAFLLVFHPSRPLKMKNTDVTVITRDGIALSATFSVPRWKPIIGAVVLVHGSGPLTREHVRGDVRDLVGLGFAVMHYDKRGAGLSGSIYTPSSRAPAVRLMDTLAWDAAAVFDTLCAQKELPGIRCGFFGASQAAWVIPLASTRTVRQPQFHILLSGPAVSTGVEGYYSGLTGDGTEDPTMTDQRTVESSTLSYSGDPGFDPRPLWDSLHTPTLWLLGDRDLSVPTFATARVIDDLVKTTHPEHTLVRFPNAGHDLRDVESRKAVAIWERVSVWYDGLE